MCVCYLELHFDVVTLPSLWPALDDCLPPSLREYDCLCAFVYFFAVDIRRFITHFMHFSWSLDVVQSVGRVSRIGR